MHWSEERFSKGIVGDQTRLRFWNKHQKIELSVTNALQQNVWKSIEVDIWFLLGTFYNGAIPKMNFLRNGDIL